MTEILKPCPFCGHTEPKIGENWNRDHCTYIYCPMCGGRGGNGWTYDAAVSAWNRRYNNGMVFALSNVYPEAKE